MNPFESYPFDFNTQIAMKAFQGVVDWVTGNTPITVTSAAKDRVAAIAEHHKIPVTVATQTITDGDTRRTSYVCAPVPEEKQVGKLAHLQKELSKMPAAALQRVGISKITLCGSLQSRTDGWIFPDITATLSGLSNHSAHTIYLSGVYSFHHELFHVMWGNNEGCGGNNVLNACQVSDAAWMALEPDKTFYDPNEERPNYAMDLFNLDTKDGQDRYDDLMKEPGSRAKMAKVKNWLKIVDPRLDEKFWADLRTGKVTDGYWQNRK